MNRPEYLVLLRPTNDGWQAVILKDEATICTVLPNTREQPKVVESWWLDYLVKQSPETDWLKWEPINVAIQRVPVKVPNDIACILIKHL